MIEIIFERAKIGEVSELLRKTISGVWNTIKFSQENLEA